MADQLTHRGPDDHGLWADGPAGIALAHRRLSIIDLSPLGHQPMHSPDGRFTIVFNGEIYNYRAIRAELENLGYQFQGHSDTEVMLAAFTVWSVEKALASFNGMFAFALWDRRERELIFARDRLGEKPLYYGQIGTSIVFASELKALRAVPDFCGQIDRDVLALYARHNYVPGPYCIFRGIRKLPPASYIRLKSGSSAENALSIRPVTYWSAREVAVSGTQHLFTGSLDEAVVEADRLLREAVRLRMQADVPLGAFLSGGVDSSTVVALMQAQSADPIRTFTIGFEQREYDEADKARAVARHLGTKHTELLVTAKETISTIPMLPSMYDEPFADSSQIPTFLVSRLARSQVTVSLSGDGGDELFGGYNRYFWGRELWNHLGSLPVGMRRALARAVIHIAPTQWDSLFEGLRWMLPKVLRQPNPGHKLHKLAGIAGASSPEEMYLRLVSYWGADLVPRSTTLPTPLTDYGELPPGMELFQRMMLLDTVTYLPDDILVKLDRASMAVSLESRVPLLDHRVVEFAWSLPPSMKVKDTTGKWLLRRVLGQYLPAHLIDTPKRGFGVPVGAWMRDQLRDWAEDLLDERRLAQDDLLNPAAIRLKWKQHLSGMRNWQDDLWGVLMFQAWRREGMGGAATVPDIPSIGKPPSIAPREAARGAKGQRETTRRGRILHVITGLRLGGAESVLVSLVTAPTRRHEHSVVSLIPGGYYAAVLRAKGVDVLELSMQPYRDAPGAIVQLSAEIRRIQPDVVQGWMYHANLVSLFGLQLSRRRSATGLIWGIRCSDMTFGSDSLQTRAVVNAGAVLSRSPDLLIANSHAGLRVHQATGYRTSRSLVIQNGIDTERFQPRPELRGVVRHELGIPDDAPVVIHVARVDPVKDHPSLLAALARLPHVHALLVGPGTDLLPNQSNVHRLGVRSDVPRLLAAGDLVISSSLSEGFSNAIAEGMAAGLPVVATDVGDSSLIVGEAGMMVPPRDVAKLTRAIDALTTNPNRAEMGRLARRTIVETHSLARSVNEFESVYDQMLFGDLAFAVGA
jgi:asparagine synthase (glutamine-hydrolysing)